MSAERFPSYGIGVHPYLSAPRPHLFGHRGASGEAPENTLPAFELALSQGMGFLEMDCQVTRDGAIVILHDERVDLVTDGTGLARDLSYAQLRELDAGYRFSPDGHRFPFRGQGVRVPRLPEILETFPTARINLEIKPADPWLVEEVVGVIARAGACDRVLLAAEKDAVMEVLHRTEPQTAIGSSIKDILEFFRALDEGSLGSFTPRGDALQIPSSFQGRSLVTAASLAAAQRVGLAVHVWTINAPAEMRALLELGVDGIMTDFPARLRRVAAPCA